MADNSTALVVGTGCLTVVLLGALYMVKKESKQRELEDVKQEDATVATSSGHMVDKEKHPGGLISVYFATQTGTSEDFAQQLEREAADRGFYISVMDIEDVDLDYMIAKEQRDADSDKARAIFLTSTYGEGEPTDNATEIANAIKERLGLEGTTSESKQADPADLDDETTTMFADKLEYCVFGLGNTQYEHYNSMGRFFDRNLSVMGGKRLLKLGLGDDDKDIEADFEAWKEELWAMLKRTYLKDSDFKAPDASSSGDQLPDCEYAIEYHTDKNATAGNMDIPLDKVHSSSRHSFTSFDCPVKVVRELRSSTQDGSTVHVEIDISKAGFDYITADNLGVLPLNDMKIVESVGKSLGYDLDAVFSLKAASNHEWHGAPFPMPITIRECLERYCDLTSAPRRSDLKLLALYASDPIDCKALTFMSSKEGKKEYKEKISDGYVGLVDLLKRCPSISIPLEHLIKISRRQMPRHYTISSSSSVHPDTIHLTVAVTQGTRSDGTKFKGVCSSHLAGLVPGKDKVRVFNRPSTFRLPKDTTRPILMVGPGTGVAPMRGLLQERHHLKSKGKSVGENVLYFGCKKSTEDFIYKDEMEAFEKDGILTKLYLAFSREQREKVYVQHLLSKNAAETWKLVNEEKGSIYVCGGVRMGHDVTEALKEIVGNEGQMSADKAKDYVAKMAMEGRFVQELWA